MSNRFNKWIFDLLIILLFFSGLSISHSALAGTVQSNFIKRMTPNVESVAHQYRLYPSVMMAQAALESDYGQSSLAVNANNYFGVKGSYNGQSVQMPTSEYNSQGQLYYVNSDFKKYPNVKSSIIDNAQLLRYGIDGDPNYYSGTWKENAINYINAANELGEKYATDPYYASNLISVIKRYRLNDLLDNIKPRKSKSTYKIIRPKYVPGAIYEQASLRPKYYDNYIYAHVPYSVRHVNDPYHWEHFGAYIGRKVYVDLKAKSKGIWWYRIRFQRSQKYEYWVKPAALRFIQPTYFSVNSSLHRWVLNPQRAYNHIYDTESLAEPVNEKRSLNRSIYAVKKFAVVTSDHQDGVWYQIRDGKDRLVWIEANPNRPVQYLPNHNTLRLKSNYRSYRLYAHVLGSNHSHQSYSLAKKKLVDNRLTSNCLAVNIKNHTMWYRVKVGNRDYWLSSDALR